MFSRPEYTGRNGWHRVVHLSEPETYPPNSNYWKGCFEAAIQDWKADRGVEYVNTWIDKIWTEEDFQRKSWKELYFDVINGRFPLPPTATEAERILL